MHYNHLIIGSSLFGATFAHLAHKINKRIRVADNCNHFAGNCYIENIEEFDIHKYDTYFFPYIQEKKTELLLGV